MGILGDVIELYGKKKSKPKLFEHTFEGGELERISREGKYSPLALSNILSRVGTQTGNVASMQKAKSRGYLESIGAGKSISGARLLSAPDTQRMSTIADVSRGLETESELSKTQAGLEYARGKDISRKNKRAWRGDFWGGVGQTVSNRENEAKNAIMTMAGLPPGAGLEDYAKAGVGGATFGYGGYKQIESDRDINEVQRLLSVGDKDAAIALIYKLLLRGD